MGKEREAKRNFSLAITLVLVAAMFSYMLSPTTTGAYSYPERAALTADREPGESSFILEKSESSSLSASDDCECLPTTTKEVREQIRCRDGSSGTQVCISTCKLSLSCNGVVIRDLNNPDDPPVVWHGVWGEESCSNDCPRVLV